MDDGKTKSNLPSVRGIYFAAVFIVAIVEAQTSYFLSQEKTSWQDAYRACAVASPHITYSHKGYSVDIDLSDVNVAVDITQMWTGYSLAYYVFSYVGCVRESDVSTSYVANFTTRLDPGHCFSACGKQGIIGIKRDDRLDLPGGVCYCFPIDMSMSDNKHLNCTDSCRNPSTTACGATGFLSLYRAADDISFDKVQYISTDRRSTDCVAYKPETGTYFWDKCRSFHVVMCSDGSQITSSGVENWLDAAVQCYRHNLHPLSNARTVTVKHITGRGLLSSYTWTGMFRSLVVTSHDDNVTHVEYGSVTKRSETNYLEFSSEPTHKVVLCQGDANVTIPPDSTRRTSSSALPTLSSGSTPTEDSTDHTSERDTTSSGIGLLQNNDTDVKIPFYIITIVGSVGTAVVAVMAVCVIVTLNRRRAKRKRTEDVIPVVNLETTTETENAVPVVDLKTTRETEDAIPVVELHTNTDAPSSSPEHIEEVKSSNKKRGDKRSGEYIDFQKIHGVTVTNDGKLRQNLLNDLKNKISLRSAQQKDKDTKCIVSDT